LIKKGVITNTAKNAIDETIMAAMI